MALNGENTRESLWNDSTYESLWDDSTYIQLEITNHLAGKIKYPRYERKRIALCSGYYYIRRNIRLKCKSGHFCLGSKVQIGLQGFAFAKPCPNAHYMEVDSEWNYKNDIPISISDCVIRLHCGAQIIIPVGTEVIFYGSNEKSTVLTEPLEAFIESL